MTQPVPVMTIAALEALFEATFPQMALGGKKHHFESLDAGRAVMRLDADDSHLRPGGTVSGPSLFALADYAAYGVILAHIGPVALAVTTGANIDFLRKPAPGAIFADARLLKLGRRLAVASVAMRDASGALVADARLTYSIPPETVPGGGG